MRGSVLTHVLRDLGFQNRMFHASVACGQKLRTLNMSGNFAVQCKDIAWRKRSPCWGPGSRVGGEAGV